MFELFENENKLIKVKSKSIYSDNEQKNLQKLIKRDINCLDVIDHFPNENEVNSFVSKGMSDAGSFLFAVYEKEGTILEATIATWTISKNNVLKLLDYIDNGKILKLNFLINDGLLKTNSTKAIYAFMRLEFDKRKDKISYAVANSHAKIQMYKTKDKYLTISGSGNWSKNPRIENYILIGGEKMYDFNCKWIKELM